MKRILIAEDDPFMRNICASRLKKDGYTVDVAPDGQAAWDKIQSSRPDLLLLDINLPRINGYDLLKMIREHAPTKDLNVIIISNLRQNELGKDIAQLGPKRYLLKIETSLDEIAQVAKDILQLR